MPVRLPVGAAMLVAVALGVSACGSSHRSSSAPTSGPTASSSRTLLAGRVRCTATVKTPVQVGDELGITFTFHNISKLPADVQLSYGGVWVIVKSPDGTAYDTRVPLENASGPGVGPTSVQPGATLTQHLVPGLRVRWRGPLRITPGCGLVASRPVRVAVTSPGLPANASAAVNAVVAAGGHLLDHCRPRTPGVAVVGRIEAPSGDIPSLQARCSIDLRREGTFDVAQVLIVTPPDLHGVQVDQTYGALTGGTTAGNRNTQALAWEFVVTRAGATSVSSANYETTRSGGRMAHGWFWSSAGPGPKSGDDFRCGGSGGSAGNANGPEVSFISLCGTGR